MDNNKRAIIEDIINHMINIQTLDYIEAGSTMRDKKSVDFKYNNHVSINSVIKKCAPCCSHDWNDYGIIRDEVYASVYEVLTKIADDYTEEQLVQIYQDIDTKNNPETHQLLVSLYKLSIFKAKMNLSGNRRSSKGLIPAFDSCEYSEDVLNGASFTTEDIDANVCFFIRFFNEHKTEFLTKKQLQFIEDPSSVNEKNHSSFRKRIYNNTLEAFQEEFTNDNDRKNEILSAINNIEKLLDNPNFESVIISAMNQRRYILDAITTYVDLPTMQRFNKGDRSYEVVKKYRISLFKKLAELNELLEEM